MPLLKKKDVQPVGINAEKNEIIQVSKMNWLSVNAKPLKAMTIMCVALSIVAAKIGYEKGKSIGVEWDKEDYNLLNQQQVIDSFAYPAMIFAHSLFTHVVPDVAHVAKKGIEAGKALYLFCKKKPGYQNIPDARDESNQKVVGYGKERSLLVKFIEVLDHIAKDWVAKPVINTAAMSMVPTFLFLAEDFPLNLSESALTFLSENGNALINIFAVAIMTQNIDDVFKRFNDNNTTITVFEDKKSFVSEETRLNCC